MFPLCRCIKQTQFSYEYREKTIKTNQDCRGRPAKLTEESLDELVACIE